MTPITIVTLDAAGYDRHLDGLANVLVDCVEGGASVSFMTPLTHAKARAFWQRLAPEVASSQRLVLAALGGSEVVGTVSLVLAQPENQPHRADLAKMLVHRSARHRGLGADLLRAAEVAARRHGKTLLVLDTVTGTDADRLYERVGWQRLGSIPGYALWPDGGLCAATIFYRKL